MNNLLATTSRLPHKTKIILYSQVIWPAMSYGAPLIAGAPKSLFPQLQRLQPYSRGWSLHWNPKAPRAIRREALRRSHQQIGGEILLQSIHASTLPRDMANARAADNTAFKECSKSNCMARVLYPKNQPIILSRVFSLSPSRGFSLHTHAKISREENVLDK